MSEYWSDREWSDKFIQRIRQIVGPIVVTTAPDFQDQRENTDLMVLSVNDGTRIAARVREFGVYEGFGHDVTFRLRRASGTETEYQKIKNGFGRWNFYGHSNQEQTDIPHWVLLDLNRFRGALIDEVGMPEPLRMKFEIVHNHDNETTFIAYDMRTFPRGIVRAASPSITMMLKRLPQYQPA